MASDIETLRRERERLDREREVLDRKLAEAERLERRQQAALHVAEVVSLTQRIDALKIERQAAILKVREVSPRHGDFDYAEQDWALTIASARSEMKQPALLDKLLAAFSAAGLHLEPRAPKFRIFRDLHALGTLHLAAKRLVIVVAGPVLDWSLITAVHDVDAKYPGLTKIDLASTRRSRRVREGVPLRSIDGDFAEGLQFAANDTGSLDVVLPLAVHALEHLSEWLDGWTPEVEARVFEPWPAPDEPEMPETSMDSNVPA